MASASILNTGKAMYAWNGTNWLPLNAQNNLLNSTRWSKVATGGETTISGYDDNGLNLSYSPGYEQLFLNGILLVRNIDYTATNGTSIDGLTAISAGSNIDIISFQSISLANVYTQEQSDTRYLSVNASANFERDIVYSSSAPASPLLGQLWVDTTTPATPILKVYNGNEWLVMSGAGGGGGLKTHFLLMGA
jgi:hypothetical protein